MSFASAIKSMRSELVLSQSEFAEELSVNVATVNRWENGRNFPNSITAEKILAYACKKRLSQNGLSRLKDALSAGSLGTGINSLNNIPKEVVNQIINDSANAVYICACDNYDLLYINKTATQYLDLNIEAAAGKKCYEYLMNRNSPCPFCSMKNKSKDYFTNFEFVHPSNGKHYFMRGKLMEWGGRLAHIEYISDDTTR